MDHSEQRMELLSEIKERGLESLSYVLFDEYSSQPYAFHLFYDNKKYKINTRDERSYVIGNTVEFDSFLDAKQYFIDKLERVVAHSMILFAIIGNFSQNERLYLLFYL